ncbi:hypothetical protein FB382_000111 [Nocardioides ginsengisegetis]|uniref:DUF4333 domain-containing protein n=1 Tax=Nocardioides ginsengisegetis TaxID=661491 RepID=A0A7W3IW84_9ACTN|nr:DUF4333 domain-containing protein [Nocardioides ginsengisegetis]MBA8801820.1 hypothetical protein [Nocardioides ginsengisegetis]
MRRFAAVPLLLALAGASLTGCSSTKSVPQADVEDQISTQLAAQVGQEPDDVSCPGDLEATKDTSMTCTLTVGEDEYDVGVTVTEVKDGTAKFDIEVADGPS